MRNAILLLLILVVVLFAQSVPGFKLVSTSGAMAFSGTPIAGWVAVATSATAAAWQLFPAAPSSSAINYYIAPGGNDSNPCSSGSKCLTLAHVLTLIPGAITQPYQINVADGTYAEPIDLGGYVSAGYGNGITILGNNSTPANVIFTGTVSKTVAGQASTNGAWVTGNLFATLQGLKVNTTADNGIYCQTCSLLVLDNVTFTGTFANSAINISDGGRAYLQDAVTASGFGANLGMDCHGFSFCAMTTAGTLTLTGSNAAACLVVEHGSHFTMSQSAAAAVADNLTISGCVLGINIAGHSGFSNFPGNGTLSVTNGGSTPGSSAGIIVGNGSAFDWVVNSPGSFTVDHYTTCLSAGTLSEISVGPSGRTLTNCTASAAVQGSVITLY